VSLAGQHHKVTYHVHTYFKIYGFLLGLNSS
jgi:hypothetical protein